ncbi:hypothetical protein ACVWZ4_006774 [Bradyrhizobium sp. USDA 4472]
MPGLGELGVALIEQPVPALQLDAMARVAARTSIPLLVDEAAFTKEEIARAGTMGCGSVYSLKRARANSHMAQSLFETSVASSIMALQSQHPYPPRVSCAGRAPIR